MAQGRKRKHTARKAQSPVAIALKTRRVEKTKSLQEFHATSRTLKDENGTVKVSPATSNQYDELSKIGSNEVIMQQEKVRRVRIPPINVFKGTRNDIITELTTHQLENYNLKPLKHGQQIYCTDVQTYTKAIKIFKDKNADFYSHDLPSEQLFKVVLYNLPKMDTQVLTAELAINQVVPAKIQTMEPKVSRYSDHCNYLLYFEKNTVQLSNLKEVRYLFHTVVNWQPYRKFKRGPTQCTRCQRPGHGSRHCNMPPRCEFCAENHISEECPNLAKFKNHAASTQPNSENVPGTSSTSVTMPGKCCNCNQIDHFASDPKCPKKLLYAARRTERTSRHQRTSKPRPDINDRKEFTDDLQQNVTSSGAVFNRQPYNVVTRNSGSTKSPPHNYNLGNPNVSVGPNNTLTQNENPLTVNEVQNLLDVIFSELQDIKHMPRAMAVRKITEISIKFMFNDGSR